MTASALKNETTLKISALHNPRAGEILTSDALAFVEAIANKFTPQLESLLEARKARQKEFDAGIKPDFLAATAGIRQSEWKVAPIPADLQDRRVEITGPVERKMIINALNSGAKVFMADFEDSLTPTWDNEIDGQINLKDANNRSIEYTSEEGKKYSLNNQTATLIVRPRGLHLKERHVTLNGKQVAGAFVDFGLYFFHNARQLIANGSGPYFYLPKLESHKEAKLWNDIFVFAQEYIGLPVGTIKATVLIEVITSCFEMEEILWELKDHIVGLNCGRWDYIYSFIKKFNRDENAVLPDRAQVVMTTHFLRTYSLLLIQTCHKRGAFAMGGMSAFIPIKNDAEKNDKAIAAVTADKEREAGDGHDGTWVAHPGLVPVAMEVFNKHLAGKKNNMDKMQADVKVTAADLLQVPDGKITEAGVRNNVSVSLQYIESWLRGLGCVPIFNLMEDAATAEISRSQLWQWAHYPKGVMEDGRKITVDLIRQIISEELEKIKQQVGVDKFAKGEFTKAAGLLDDLISKPEFTEFLTLPAYELLG